MLALATSMEEVLNEPHLAEGRFQETAFALVEMENAIIIGRENVEDKNLHRRYRNLRAGFINDGQRLKVIRASDGEIAVIQECDQCLKDLARIAMCAIGAIERRISKK